MTDVFKGATSRSIFFELVDSTTGLPKTGILYTDVTGSYVRTRSARVAITMATLASASAAYSSGGFILVDDTNQPGVYRLDVPDGAYATGVEAVVVTLKATGCRTVSRLFNLVDINNQVAYAPNAVAGATNGLFIAGTNAATTITSALTTTFTGNLTGSVASVTAGVTLAASAVTAIWDALTSGMTTAGSIGKKLADWVVGTIDTYTGNTKQTGDGYAILSHVTYGNAALKTILDVIAQDTTTDIPALIASTIASLQVNTRAMMSVPIEIELPDSGTAVEKVYLALHDVDGNMEAPDSTPTIALTNASGTDRSSRLSIATNLSTGFYSWDYTKTAGDTEEQLSWVFTVVEGGKTRVYPATSYIVEESAYRFSSSDRSTLNAAATATALAAVQSDTNDIQTRIPAALGSGGFMMSDLRSVNDNVDVDGLSLLGQHLDFVTIGMTDYLSFDSALLGTGLASQTSVDDLPTNAELATSQAAADDATLAAIALEAVKTAAIKAKTDNLPTDPADQSAVEAAITAATSPLATQTDLATTMLWVKRNAVILSGIVTGAGTATEVFTISTLGITGTITVDASGNRSVVVWS